MLIFKTFSRPVVLTVGGEMFVKECQTRNDSGFGIYNMNSYAVSLSYFPGGVDHIHTIKA